MYGFKKFLVALIPQVVLGLAFLICSLISFGGFSSNLDTCNLAFAGLCMGAVILVSYLNDEEIHTVWKVFCWIGFGLFALIAIAPIALDYARREGLHANYPLEGHLAVGFLLGSALMLIYLYVILRIRIWEEESWISKLIVPAAILIVGTIAGGFIRLGGLTAVVIMSRFCLFGPIVVIIVLSILFAKFDVYVGSDDPVDHSSSSSRSGRTPSYAEIYNALIDTTASYSSGGCTVYLRITNVHVSNGSVTYDYEKKVSRNGSGDPDQVGLVAERDLAGKVRIKLTRLGLL